MQETIREDHYHYTLYEFSGHVGCKILSKVTCLSVGIMTKYASRILDTIGLYMSNITLPKYLFNTFHVLPYLALSIKLRLYGWMIFRYIGFACCSRAYTIGLHLFDTKKSEIILVRKLGESLD